MNSAKANQAIPNRVTRCKIAAFACCDVRTIENWLTGRSTPRPALLVAIKAAAAQLGIELPEPRKAVRS